MIIAIIEIKFFLEYSQGNNRTLFRILFWNALLGIGLLYRIQYSICLKEREKKHKKLKEKSKNKNKIHITDKTDQTRVKIGDFCNF